LCPRCVGPWELVAPVAEGAVTGVFRARPAESSDASAHYALKLLRPRWQDEPEAVAMLRREARVGRAISHANLVPVLQFHLAEPPYYLVMPWLSGKTLAAGNVDKQHWRTSFALCIVRQTAQALEALHAGGWRHGDVKPQNILVSPEGHVTLLDLGFARSVWQRDPVADRCVQGTWHYLAPEMASPTRRADIRADIYSLGVVLYELLAGRLPFTSDDLAELARLHREAAPARLSGLAPDLPEEVVGLVHRMIAKSPLRRPRTPGDLIDDLVRLEIATFDIPMRGSIQNVA